MNLKIILKYFILFKFLVIIETKKNDTNFFENNKNLTKKLNENLKNSTNDKQNENLPNKNLPMPIKIQNDDYDDEPNSKNKDSPRKLHNPKLKGSKESTTLNNALQIAAKEGIKAMVELYEKTEPKLLENGHILDAKHPATLLSKFSAPTEGSENSAKAAFATLIATKYFQKSYKEQSSELGRQAPTPRLSFRRTSLEGLCPPRDFPRCLPAAQRYRTHDGTCNNPKRPRWGSAQLPFNRFLPPEYGDGVESIRGSVDGGTLSSARFVSLVVHGARDGNSPVTLMLAQWGQLIDHDLTSTAQPRSINGSVPRCCGANDFHPSCLPIKVPRDDPWLAPIKVRCLEFLRSAPAQRRDCILSWREQTNQATSYLDASPVYSSNARNSDSARIFRNGLLFFGRGNNPRDDVCLRGAIDDQCIRSGDGRSGEQPGLLAMHHVWVGEHNRIALELSDLNRHWSDEKIYQETRRIVGALFQHITYREFLPLVLGREVIRLFDLELLNSGYYPNYDPNVNPSVANAFAAAAFRFGHSLVQGSYMRCDRNHNFLDNNVTLHEEFARGDLGGPGSLHRLLRGMAAQHSQKRDEFITPELTNHLFQSENFPFGLDLAAINIQRGRDHGIPPYTAWREPCGLSPIDSWEALENIVGPESTKRISHAYRSVHDIDLFVGGIAERPVIGGLVGPTFACIIAQQFSNLRKGDRFWYENSGFENSFTPAQLHSIRRVSLAQVLCRTIGGGTFQPHIFIPHDAPGNERIRCGVDQLAPIDLIPWLEQDPFLTTDSKQQSIPLPNKNHNSSLLNRVDFIPNGSTGLQRPNQHNNTKIHDKLDISTRPSEISNHIHNKLDAKRHKIVTSKNRQTTTNKPLEHLTTRRTVIINNVPLILRRSINENLQLEPQIRTEDLTIHNTKTIPNEGRGAIYLEIERKFNKDQNNTKTTTDNTELTKIEQRQYNKQDTIYGTFKRPQKVIIPTPDAEEYEIEINIRQTNNKRPTIQNYNDRYDQNTASTPFNYRPITSPRPPHYEQSYGQGQYTKPPTIIYLNDHDDYNGQTTTKAPGLLQTFFMIGSNNILGHFQRPNNVFSSNNGANEESISIVTGSPSPTYNNRPRPSSGSIVTSSSGRPNINDEFQTVISSSSSSNSYGSSSSSSVSVNLRPPQPNVQISVSSEASTTSRPTYGLQANPNYSQYSTAKPYSPFSSTDSNYYNTRPDIDNYHLTTTRRPYYRPTNNYYPRENDLPEFKNAPLITNKTINELKEIPTDYDMTTYTPILMETTDDKDYYYYDNDENDTETQTTNFDKDGYLRPEHMLLDILNHDNHDDKNITKLTDNNKETNEDDDYVLPALQKTGNDMNLLQNYENLTSYTDAIPRRPSFEILAEDYDEITQKPFVHNFNKIKIRKNNSLIAFAPLNVLTKPERPDNWVIFDTPEEKPLLPEQPDIEMGNHATMEFPKPMITIRKGFPLKRIQNVTRPTTGSPKNRIIRKTLKSFG